MAPPFNPNENVSDRETLDGLRTSKARFESLTNRRDVLDTRLSNAREQTSRIPAPRKSLILLLVAAMGMFALGFGPTIFTVFLSGVEDTLLAWGASLAIGAAAGGFLALLLLNFEEEN